MGQRDCGYSALRHCDLNELLISSRTAVESWLYSHRIVQFNLAALTSKIIERSIIFAYITQTGTRNYFGTLFSRLCFGSTI